MRGAETSTIMLPHGRRVHCHDSASFKIMFDKFQTYHKNDTFFLETNENVKLPRFAPNNASCVYTYATEENVVFQH